MSLIKIVCSFKRPKSQDKIKKEPFIQIVDYVLLGLYEEKLPDLADK